ncbi:XdhC/CoxI family protein [Segetibacter sp. 3557_3]|uniref:XdhC family protein n=1 Tax=Segetibacter sp. 3557_3 TaxID=2547429 RepID=UPI001058954B|nr:XdhC/CoxI family protein [Segetibacter sp. 3557_3]TDH25682.1 XdhC/CoxI family protein [Segetibacter sp. 3557_3]
MQRKILVWKSILHDVTINLPVALLYVTESSGSSPGRRGFMMAVSANGVITGSIGGGIMEHKFAELAKAHLNNAYSGATWFRQYHDKVAATDQSGMICSGAQAICIYVPAASDREPLQQIIGALDKNQGGTMTISSSGIRYAPEITGEDGAFEASSPQAWRYTEHLILQEQLYLVGGGHCSLALSAVMHSLGFTIHLFDDRPDLGTFALNTSADSKTILADYSALGSHIPEGENKYVVIMTQGYRTDYLALRSIAGSAFRYIGVLGSKNKIIQLLRQLEQEGVDQTWLSRLHAPVGLPIKSETPDEIAISIAAEIIMVKNAKGQ